MGWHPAELNEKSGSVSDPDFALYRGIYGKLAATLWMIGLCSGAVEHRESSGTMEVREKLKKTGAERMKWRSP